MVSPRRWKKTYLPLIRNSIFYSLKLAKFEQSVALGKHQGLALHGHPYKNRTTCREMIDLIDTVMEGKLLVKLNKVKCFTSLFDGSTDVAML